MNVLNRLVIGFSFIGLISRRTTTTTLSEMANQSYVPGSNSIAYVTTPNDEAAKKIAHGVISKKLAACVNIIPNLTSIYEWDGHVNEDSEVLLMIKTSTEKVDELSKFVRENHPYSVAEVISVKIENGNPPYLDWITKSVPPPLTKTEF